MDSYVPLAIRIVEKGWVKEEAENVKNKGEDVRIWELLSPHIS